MSTRKAIPWAIAAVLALVAFKAIIVPQFGAKRTRVGNFDIATTSYSVLGGRYPMRAITYVGTRRHEKLGSELGPFHVHPSDPDRIVYEDCPDRVKRSCGSYYYNGRWRKKYKIGVSGVIDQLDVRTERPIEPRWSRDGRHVVLLTPQH